MTREGALRAAAATLAEAGVPDPAREARLLLRWASGLDGAAMSARLDAAPSPEEAARFDAAVARRAARAPLSHITGRRAFGGHEFVVSAAVLDPRPETELLVDWALEERPPARVLDLGVGSGCILLSLLAAWPQATGLGVDASDAALAVARANADALGVAGRATLARGDWLAGVAERFDLVVSNPPYLSGADMAALQPEVRAEPALALAGGEDGLEAYRRIAARLAEVMTPGGAAFFEVGAGQAAQVAAILRDAGLADIAVRKDLGGHARAIRARRLRE